MKLTSYPASSRRTTWNWAVLRASKSSCSDREPVLGLTRTRFSSSSSYSSSSSEAEYMWWPGGELEPSSSSEDENGNHSWVYGGSIRDICSAKLVKVLCSDAFENNSKSMFKTSFIVSSMLQREKTVPSLLHRLEKTSSMQSRRRDLHHTWLHHNLMITTFSTKIYPKDQI